MSSDSKKNGMRAKLGGVDALAVRSIEQFFSIYEKATNAIVEITTKAIEKRQNLKPHQPLFSAGFVWLLGFEIARLANGSIIETADLIAIGPVAFLTVGLMIKPMREGIESARRKRENDEAAKTRNPQDDKNA